MKVTNMKQPPARQPWMGACCVYEEHQMYNGARHATVVDLLTPQDVWRRYDALRAEGCQVCVWWDA